MTTKKVLSNIYYFATEILQTAHLNTNWNEAAIQKAFQWAAYCLRVCNECSAIPEKKMCLNEMLAEIFFASADWNGPNVTVDTLKHSKDQLCLSLLQNPYLPEDCRQCIIKSYVDSGQTQEFTKLCTQLTVAKAGLTLSLDALGVCGVKAWPLTTHHFAELWLTDALPSQLTGSEELFCQRLDFLGSTQLVLLLELLAEKPDSLLDQEMQESIVQWLLHQTSCTVWQVPTSLLSRVAALRSSFYKAYIKFLVGEVEKLQAIYTKSGYHWEARLDSMRNLRYWEIVNHFSELCGRSEMLAKLTLYIISKYATKSSVWLDISTDLKTMDKLVAGGKR